MPKEKLTDQRELTAEELKLVSGGIRTVMDIIIDAYSKCLGAASDVVGIWRGVISGHLKVSFQAARSIG